MNKEIICFKCKNKTELEQDEKYPFLYHCKLCGWDYHEVKIKKETSCEMAANEGEEE